MGKFITEQKRNCILCNKLYLPNSNSQKVCDICKMRKCKFCGKNFIIQKLRKEKYKGDYCSRECYLKKRFGTGKCRLCEKISKYAFCSNKCRNNYWNKNDYHLRRKRKIWEKKLELMKELGGKCKKCGIADIQVLEINHIDKDKKNRPPKLQYTWQRRFKEWNENKNNLELLCANCHRKLTWIQMGWGKY